MRKTALHILFTASAVLTLSGCASKDNEPGPSGRLESPDFTATIGLEQTRAYDQSWEQGDEIGVTGCGRTDICYVTNTGNGNFRVKNAGEQIYFQQDDEVEFTAYYPWTNLSAGKVIIDADTKDQSGQKSFDFLWAKATGSKKNPKVSFTFSHCMAKLYMTLNLGNGISYEEMKNAKLTLQGFSHIGSFNTSDGSTTLTASAGVWNFTEYASANEAYKTLSFSFIFFPQLLAAPIQFIAEVDMGGSDRLSLQAAIDFTSANREKDGTNARNEWVAGRQYNLNLTLNKTDVVINDCVINPWNTVTGDEISVD